MTKHDGGRHAFLGAGVPIVGAPMAGGASSPALVEAVARGGAFPFLPGGYQQVEVLAEEVRQLTSAGIAFGVNLFAPSPAPILPADYLAYARRLQPEADPYGITLAERPLIEDDDGFDDKLALLREDPVAVVSTTFGLPTPAQVESVQRVGTMVAATVTTVDEAVAAVEAGVDLLVAQGSEAGGHSGTFDPARVISPMPAVDLVQAVRASGIDLPIVAGGGVDGPEAVRALLGASAAAVAVGTLLLRCDESGASATHREALADPAYVETAITRAFTGRPARGLRNGFMDRHSAGAPVGYPAIHHLTSSLRRAAAEVGDAERVHLWAGTGFRKARAEPAVQIIESLVAGL